MISIHAPHTRGDSSGSKAMRFSSRFQSTPLIRGATRLRCRERARTGHFNPRPSYEGRPWSSWRASAASYFNPRPSYEGRLWAMARVAGSTKFQSTPLIRGATIDDAYHRRGAYISIHAPHTRGDRGRVRDHGGPGTFQSTPLIRGVTVHPTWRFAFARHFNPRPSYEGRPARDG